jgi:hypothetical protein
VNKILNALVVTSFGALLAAGCAQPSTGNSGEGGSTGTPGSAGTTGNAGSPGTGKGGTTGVAGSINNGKGGTTGSAGATGVAGSTTGKGGTTGAAGTTGVAGGGAGTTGNAGTTGAAGSTTGGGGSTGNAPAGYWTSGTWHGCAWTGIDNRNMGTTPVMPSDFTTKTDNGPYCVKGTVGGDPMYETVALLGFNLAEPVTSSLSCAYKPVDTTADGPPEVTLTGSGLAISFSKKVASVLRVQIQGKDGGKDGDTGANDRWCYTITDPAGPIFAPFNKFNTKCWDNSGTYYTNQGIDSVVFLVPGNTAAMPYDFCIGGFATGNDVSAAPPCPACTSDVTGTIGGSGSTDLDFQRVKVKGDDGKSYIIQNNNWGNPSGTNQTISYHNNSFTITSPTGAGAGGGVPASFPSIYIGANGDTQNGTFSTTSDDSLPKQVSTIQSVMTDFSYTSASGNYNATYDVWFSSSKPAGRYDDGISGFVMVWFYKPSQNQPIGSKMRTATINGKTFDVWVGPRGGSKSNSNAPVVSYVAQSTMTSWSFDLKAFITDAATNGIQSSWYLTDVFAGFEIWDGSGTNNLGVTKFHAVVK